MRVLDATVETAKADGSTRHIPLGELHRLPGDRPEQDTVLERGELITAVTLPPPVGGKQIYRKVRERASYAYALVSVAAVIQPDGTGRVALGGVAPRPWRREEAEAEMQRGEGRQGPAAGRTHENAYKITLEERTLAGVLEEART